MYMLANNNYMKHFFLLLLVCVRYGYFLTEVSYYLCYNTETIKTIFNTLRGNKKVKKIT